MQNIISHRIGAIVMAELDQEQRTRMNTHSLWPS